MTKPRQIQDKYFKRAKAAGYRARSVYKLQEIQEKFQLLKPTDNILDLGAAPGSFLQYISRLLRDPAVAIGVDLTPINPIHPRVKTYVGDIFDEALMNNIFIQNNCHQVDVITSDLAPKTTGIKDLDQARSVELNTQALRLALKYLKRNGHLLLKVFQGEDFPKLLRQTKAVFKQVHVFKPHACQEASRETYIVALNKLT